MRIPLWAYSIILAFGMVLLPQLATWSSAQETIISKKDADYVFSLTKLQWERDSKKFFAPGWIVKSAQYDTGTGVMGLDPSTGFGLSIQPLYVDDKSMPAVVIVGNYFPIGTLPPITDELQRNMESDARKDLGPDYTVKLKYQRQDKLDVIELSLTKINRLQSSPNR